MTWTVKERKKKKQKGKEKGSFTQKFHLLQAAKAEGTAFEFSRQSWSWKGLTPNPEHQLQNLAAELGLQGEPVEEKQLTPAQLPCNPSRHLPVGDS